MYRELVLSEINPILCFATQLQAVAAPVAVGKPPGTDRGPPKWVALEGEWEICFQAARAIRLLLGLYRQRGVSRSPDRLLLTHGRVPRFPRGQTPPLQPRPGQPPRAVFLLVSQKESN